MSNYVPGFGDYPGFPSRFSINHTTTSFYLNSCTSSLAFNANSTEIEKMDTGLKNLELTLDEEERLLQNSSGDESSNKKVVSSVGGLTPSDLAKIASLRTLKNKRNHDRKRLRKQATPAALVNQQR